jgi:hypothetical protein
MRVKSVFQNDPFGCIFGLEAPKAEEEEDSA